MIPAVRASAASWITGIDFSDSEKHAIVWGDSTPACATISSLSYDNESITAVLKRPNRFLPGPSASGDVAIEINRDCNPDLTCLGDLDLTGNCYTPFFSPESSAFTASAPGAALNYASFDAVIMPKSKLKGTGLSHASFAGANLREVDFDGAVMVYTDFTDADLTDAHAYGAFVYKTIAPNGEEVNSVDALLNKGHRRQRQQQQDFQIITLAFSRSRPRPRRLFQFRLSTPF